MLNTIMSVSVTILSLVFLDPILYGMGASPETLPYARDFMQIILIGNVFLHLYLGLNNIMRASGYPRKAMITTLLTVAVNIVLAPLFIFVFHWGIRGAALATVLAQIFGTLWVFSHFASRGHSIYFLPGYFKLKKKVIGEIISIGIANFLMLTVASLVVVIINLGLEKHGGDLAIGAFGIINSIMNLIVFIVIGINQGMQPIAGYNFGARQYDRVRHVFKLTILAASVISTIGFLWGELLPRQISSLFTNNRELIGLSTNGMRIAVMMFPIIGIQIVTSSFFQSIGKAWISIFLSLSRQVLALIPLVIILPHFFGLNGVWYSMPLSDLASSILTMLVLRQQLSGEVLRK
jgi:putative MATE family efflux protein